MKKPLIRYGWLRAILFLAIYLLTTVIVMTITWGVWRIFQDGDSSFTVFNQLLPKVRFINIGVNLVSAILSIAFARKVIDRQSFLSLGFAWKGYETHAYTGFFGAIAMLGSGTIILLIAKYVSISDITFNALDVLNGAAMMLLVAVYEELIFRGYILNNLMQSMNKWIALSISALFFTVMHLGNPGMGVISFIEIFVAGIMLGINYIYTKNLWFGILLHFSWNFFQGPVFGYEVSGINLPSILHQSLNGPEVMTGGSFGFEGSILSMILNLIFIGVLVTAYEKGTVKTGKNVALKTA